MELKTPREIEIMREGGRKLGKIRRRLEKEIKDGVNAFFIEKLATKLIAEYKGIPSFKMVPGYFWSTCINVNDGVVHGIPRKNVVFRKGDIVSLDLGFYFKGFHTDTSTSVLVDGVDTDKKEVLEGGKKALKNAIAQARIGNSVGMISKSIEDTLKKAGLNPVKSLFGHGVGRKLHEEPYIPCFVSGSSVEALRLTEGLVLAIEVIYSKGSGEVVTDKDGWTIRTKDATIAALFEETVAITKRGPYVLTR